MPNSPKVTVGYRYRGRKPSQGLQMKAAATPDACFAQCVAWNNPGAIANPDPCTHWVHVANPLKNDGVTPKVSDSFKLNHAKPARVAYH